MILASSFSLFISVENNNTSSVLTSCVSVQILYSPICCNHLVNARSFCLQGCDPVNMKSVKCMLCAWTLIFLDIVKGGYCSTHMNYETHFQFISFAYTHSSLDIHFKTLNNLKTKVYEGKEKIMSHIYIVVFGVHCHLNLIPKHRLIHYPLFIFFSRQW